MLFFVISDSTTSREKYEQILIQLVLPNYHENSVKLLRNNNPKGRWIGCLSKCLDWPIRSPDLTICEFILTALFKGSSYHP